METKEISKKIIGGFAGSILPGLGGALVLGLVGQFLFPKHAGKLSLAGLVIGTAAGFYAGYKSTATPEEPKKQ